MTTPTDLPTGDKVPAVLKPQLEPRVSEETFNRIRLLTGEAFRGIKNSTIRMLVDGTLYEVTFDEHGNAKPARELGSVSTYWTT